MTIWFVVQQIVVIGGLVAIIIAIVKTMKAMERMSEEEG